MEEELNMIAHMDPKSPLVEAYRMLRTSLQFSHIDSSLKSIAITSATPNEGKSTVSSNLAIVLAQAGNKVLIIDCDFRNPTQHKNFKRSNQKGLSNCIAERDGIQRVVQATDIENVYFIAAGPTPPNPSELLGSKYFQLLLKELEQEYEYILIDTPPIMPVTDAAVVGSKVDGVILVVEYGAISPGVLKEAKSRLDSPHINLLGVVLSKVEVSADSGYGYYHYYGEH